MYTNQIEFFSLITVSYLIGSIPFGLIISLVLKKDDPRTEGSQNIGATNITRLSGWKLGLLTLSLDVFKAFLTIKMVYIINSNLLNYSMIFLLLGHLFNIWLKFRGGKGVAVLLGILLSYSPIYGAIFMLSWISIALLFKYSSVAALISSIIILTSVIVQNDPEKFALIIIFFLIFLKHKSNIERLIKGNEIKIKIRK